MSYLERARAAADRLRAQKSAVILAIESSCDETAAAVVRDGRELLSDVVHSQIDLHTLYGGVVPEIASRAHVDKIMPVVREALRRAEMAPEAVDAIAVTYGPGLVGALLVGVSFAKGLAFSLSKPLYAVNHIEGHICANYLSHPELQPPFLCLVASGGHSHLVMVEDLGVYRLIGCTQDDAAGEAFDKAARLLGLAYPGGPRLDDLAEQGDPERFPLPKPHTQGICDYSFSGLKTAMINLCHRFEQKGEPLPRADLAASYRAAVVSQLLDKAALALDGTKAKRFALAGGVAANRLLRREAMALCGQRGIRCYLPEPRFCGDNAAMIASAAYGLALRGEIADMRLNAQPALRLIDQPGG